VDDVSAAVAERVGDVDGALAQGVVERLGARIEFLIDAGDESLERVVDLLRPCGGARLKGVDLRFQSLGGLFARKANLSVRSPPCTVSVVSIAPRRSARWL